MLRKGANIFSILPGREEGEMVGCFQPPTKVLIAHFRMYKGVPVTLLTKDWPPLEDVHQKCSVGNFFSSNLGTSIWTDRTAYLPYMQHSAGL